MWRYVPPVLSPCLGWLLSLALPIGLSACGPALSDPASNVGSHASLNGASTANPAQQDSPSSRNDLTKPATSLVPLASLQELVTDQKKAPPPRPDRSLLSDRTNQSGDASEQPGILPMMNVWTPEGIPLSVVVLEEPIDDASLDDDANTERRNWDIAHETEQLEDKKEQEERFDERKE
ncbi:MAG: hypothetical protein E8D48_09225 [Nitrospira sp.]|nr:MAG: hypothetical protein E8D48_09225 [Nitrospira sp.]